MCNFSGMIKNVLPSPRQGGRPAKDLQPTKSIRSGTARDSFSQTPHMRGKVIVDLVLTERHRITPACAGKSLRLPSPAGWAEDHPRMCGEKPLKVWLASSIPGSPPRMRGKATGELIKLALDRITPAHAGKRPRAPCTLATTTDHPRVCGEKTPMLPCLIQPWGSPPHVRGKVLIESPDNIIRGITPACAGKRYNSRRAYRQW